MRTTRTLTFGAAAVMALATGACSRTENGDVVVKRPEVSVKTTEDTMRVPTVTTRTDTINTPVVGTQDGDARRQEAGRRNQKDRSQGSCRQEAVMA